MIHWLRVYGPPVLAWIFVVGKLSLPRKQLSDSNRRVGLTVLFMAAISLTVITPAGGHAVFELTGVPNLGRLVGHVAFLLVLRAAYVYLLELNHPKDEVRRKRWDLGRLIAVIVLLVIIFRLSNTPVDVPRFNGVYSDTPGVLEYWIALLCYLVPVLGNLVVLGWRHSRRVDDRPRKFGFRSMAFGVACAIAYHVHKLLFYAASRFDVGYPAGTRSALDVMLPFAGAVLILVGPTTPVWLWVWLRLSDARDWWNRCGDYRMLHSLWRDIAPGAERRSLLVELFDLWYLRVALHQRFIGIRDGRLALQAYMDPWVATSAWERASRAGIAGTELEAEVEAATLAAARRASSYGGRNIPVTAELPPGGTDLETDTRFLVSVARAYRRLSP